jgi:hypothetical protein
MMTPDYNQWITEADALRHHIELEHNARSNETFGGGKAVIDDVTLETLVADHVRFGLELAILTRTSMRGVSPVQNDALRLGMWGLNMPVPTGVSVTWQVTATDAAVSLMLGNMHYDMSSYSRNIASLIFSTDVAIMDDHIFYGGRVLLFGARLSAHARQANEFALDFTRAERPQLAAEIAFYTHAIIYSERARHDAPLVFGLIPCGDISDPIAAAEALIRGIANAVVEDLFNSGAFGSSADALSREPNGGSSAFAAAIREMIAGLQLSRWLELALVRGFYPREARLRLAQLQRPIHQAADSLSQNRLAIPLVMLCVDAVRASVTRPARN